jgi:hypothetical protein
VELLTPQLADFRRGQSESLLRAQSPPRNISEIRNSVKLDRADLSDRAISFLKGKSTAHAKNETGFETGFETDSRSSFTDQKKPSGPGRAKCPKRRRFVSRFRARALGGSERNQKRKNDDGFRFFFFAFALGHRYNMVFGTKRV